MLVWQVFNGDKRGEAESNLEPDGRGPGPAMGLIHSQGRFLKAFPISPSHKPWAPSGGENEHGLGNSETLALRAPHKTPATDNFTAH